MTKKKTIHISLLLLLLLAVSSCEGKYDWSEYKDDYKAYKMGIQLSTDKLEFAEGQTKQTFTVTCECPWILSVESEKSYYNYNSYSYEYDWLTVNIIPHRKDGYDEVEVKAKNNPLTTQSRKTTIYISDGLKYYSISVTQAPSAETLSVSPTSLTFNWNGGSQDIAVASNVRWNVSSADNWCNVNTQSNNLFLISVSKNDSYNARSTTVSVEGTTKTATISITQQAPSEPVISELSFSDITKTTAVCTFSYSSADLEVTQCGIYYSTTNQNPTSSDGNYVSYPYNKSGSFSRTLTGLKQNTTYYVRPYVITSAGTTYGTASSFTTKKTNSPEEEDNPTPGY